jgi:hypothetical protein
MTAKKPSSEVAKEEAPPEAPQFYVADEPLFVHDPESGVAPARAFNPDDHVPPDLVEAHGWQDKVHDPRSQPDPEPGRAVESDQPDTETIGPGFTSASSTTAPAPGAAPPADNRKEQ